MENISITNILDKLEDKVKLARIELKLSDFRMHTIREWINKKDRIKYNDKVNKDIEVCAKEIMEVLNGSKG